MVAERFSSLTKSFLETSLPFDIKLPYLSFPFSSNDFVIPFSFPFSGMDGWGSSFFPLNRKHTNLSRLWFVPFRSTVELESLHF